MYLVFKAMSSKGILEEIDSLTPAISKWFERKVSEKKLDVSNVVLKGFPKALATLFVVSTEAYRGSFTAKMLCKHFSLEDVRKLSSILKAFGAKNVPEVSDEYRSKPWEYVVKLIREVSFEDKELDSLIGKLREKLG